MSDTFDYRAAERGAAAHLVRESRGDAGLARIIAAALEHPRVVPRDVLEALFANRCRECFAVTGGRACCG